MIVRLILHLSFMFAFSPISSRKVTFFDIHIQPTQNQFNLYIDCILFLIAESFVHETIELQLSEAFVIPLDRTFFSSWTEFDLQSNHANETVSKATALNHTAHPLPTTSGRFRLWAQQQNRPDLPSWVRLKHCAQSEYAYLYGSPSRVGLYQLELIVLYLPLYRWRVIPLNLRVQPRPSIACNHVQIKLFHLDIEDLLSTRIESLLDIFVRHLWPIDGSTTLLSSRSKRVQSNSNQSNQSNQSIDSDLETSVQHLTSTNRTPIYLSNVLSTQDAGLRLPLDPNEKIGVLLQIGGVGRFSSQLMQLQRELRPLKQLRSCPSDYRASSAEHLFRARQFVVDWCHFDLISGHCPSTLTVGQPQSRTPDNTWTWNRSDSAPTILVWPDNRNYRQLIAVNLAVISLLALLLFVTLVCASCS
jgi:hypothetical protein